MALTTPEAETQTALLADIAEETEVEVAAPSSITALSSAVTIDASAVDGGNTRIFSNPTIPVPGS